ncbi:MAG: hypothetical protein ACYTEP_09590 [Planctomycetota bacterium]|jgi:MFS family permease
MIDLLLQDPTPWFSTETSAMVGGFGGAAVGILGGCVGAAAGVLAPKGKGRGFVLGTMTSCAALGVLVLIAGIYALIVGQPYGVWYPLVLLGALLTGVIGGLIPMVRKRYAEAEQRRLDADDLRRS